jgi:hypothetical protein
MPFVVSSEKSLLPWMRPSAFQVLCPWRTSTTRLRVEMLGRRTGGSSCKQSDVTITCFSGLLCHVYEFEWAYNITSDCFVLRFVSAAALNCVILQANRAGRQYCCCAGLLYLLPVRWIDVGRL